MRAELRGTAALLSMPLDVSGTTADPSVFPTRGAMFGAVAGSVLMPGLGTAVGIKAGEFTEQLFGPQEKRQAEQLLGEFACLDADGGAKARHPDAPRNRSEHRASRRKHARIGGRAAHIQWHAEQGRRSSQFCTHATARASCLR